MTKKSTSFRWRKSTSRRRSKVLPSDVDDSSSDPQFSGQFDNPLLSYTNDANGTYYSSAFDDRRHKEQMEVLRQLGTAVQALSVAVDGNDAAIKKLHQAVGEIKHAAPQRDVIVPPKAAAPGRPLLDEDNAVSAISSPKLDPDDGLERKQVRLDGLEVYAVVSAVTAGTLVAVFDSYHPGDMVDLFQEQRYLEVLMCIAFFVTGSVGIVCSLHCIFVFSLITMYGRTALGMERDDALEVFFLGTGLQRSHGFKTFVGSLYALMCELTVVITSKVSNCPWVHLTALAITARLMYCVYDDTQMIMDKAGVIFTPPPKPKKKKKELKENGVLDADNNETTPRSMHAENGSALNPAATGKIGEQSMDKDDDGPSDKKSTRHERAAEASKARERKRESAAASNRTLEDFPAVNIHAGGYGLTANKRISAMNYAA